MNIQDKIIEGLLLDDDYCLSLAELSRACSIHPDWIIELVNEGILEPQGIDVMCWRFHPQSIKKVQIVLHLQKDLGVNLAGAALVLDLLEQIHGQE